MTRRFKQGYDIEKGMNYLSIRIEYPDTQHSKQLLKDFSMMLELLFKAYNLERYNRKSKYDKDLL